MDRNLHTVTGFLIKSAKSSQSARGYHLQQMSWNSKQHIHVKNGIFDFYCVPSKISGKVKTGNSRRK